MAGAVAMQENSSPLVDPFTSSPRSQRLPQPRWGEDVLHVLIHPRIGVGDGAIDGFGFGTGGECCQYVQEKDEAEL